MNELVCRFADALVPRCVDGIPPTFATVLVGGAFVFLALSIIYVFFSLGWQTEQGYAPDPTSWFFGWMLVVAVALFVLILVLCLGEYALYILGLIAVLMSIYYSGKLLSKKWG